MRTQLRAQDVAPEPVELGRRLDTTTLSAALLLALSDFAAAEPQKAFPAIAEDAEACARLSASVRSLRTGHTLYNLDSRYIDFKPESVDLVVTSPPYWTLKKYNDGEGQLGVIEDYDGFLDDLDEVWRNAVLAYARTSDHQLSPLTRSLFYGSDS